MSVAAEPLVYFYVPGYKPNYIEYAMTFYPMNIILCLEDGTPEEKKLEARYVVKNALQEFSSDSEHTLIVRVNSVHTPHWEQDLEELVPERPARIRLPMVRTAEDLRQVERKVQDVIHQRSLNYSPSYEVMIECCEAIANLGEIHQASRNIYAFTFGGTDYFNDCVAKGLGDPALEVRKAKQKLGEYCRSVGLQCFDTTYMAYRDLEGFREDCLLSREYGFTGRSVIHPDQVAVVQDIYGISIA
ncbi:MULTISPECIES: HpcH/HpaI aldolase/citrate lyase family protein [unclassified Paenibacillus]|uniref:HpcH/HpaI aldolase/citrate lyase family protein n=1 Tax=unclassified Paenibacillus TaxID=185978 RepID=UPI0030F9C1F2